MSDPNHDPDLGQETPGEVLHLNNGIPADIPTEVENNDDVRDEQQVAVSKPKSKRAPSKPKPVEHPNPLPPGQVRFPAELPQNLVLLFREWMVANQTNIIPQDIYYMQSPWIFKIHDSYRTSEATDAAYFHAGTNQGVHIRVYILRWMTEVKFGANSQRLIVAFSHRFREPVILCRQKKGSNEFRIWRGVRDNPSEQTTIMKKPTDYKGPGAKGVQRTAPVLSGPASTSKLNVPAVPNFMTPNFSYQTNDVHAGAMQNRAAPIPAGFNTGMHNNSMVSVAMSSHDAFNSIMSTALTTTSTVPNMVKGNVANTNAIGRSVEEMDVDAAEDATPLPNDSSNDGSSTDNRKPSSSPVPSQYPELNGNDQEDKQEKQVDEDGLGNAFAMINNDVAQPSLAFNPGTPTIREVGSKVLFRFYDSQHQVRERKLRHCSTFPSFFAHAVAGRVITEFDPFKIFLCDWSVMNGVPNQMMLVDDQDWQELLQMVLADPGWASPQAIAIINVTKKLW